MSIDTITGIGPKIKTVIGTPPGGIAAGTEQVTVWPAAAQPAGKAPIVKPAGITSVMVATAVVATVPVFVSWRV